MGSQINYMFDIATSVVEGALGVVSLFLPVHYSKAPKVGVGPVAKERERIRRINELFGNLPPIEPKKMSRLRASGKSPSSEDLLDAHIARIIKGPVS